LRKYLFLIVQALIMLALTALTAICPYFLYGMADAKMVVAAANILQWTLVPLCGAATAYWLTRKGINQYLTWILPPVCYSALPWLVIGYPPKAGVMLLCVFVSVVGAAAGEVKNRMYKENK